MFFPQAKAAKQDLTDDEVVGTGLIREGITTLLNSGNFTVQDVRDICSMQVSLTTVEVVKNNFKPRLVDDFPMHAPLNTEGDNAE